MSNLESKHTPPEKAILRDHAWSLMPKENLDFTLFLLIRFFCCHATGRLQPSNTGFAWSAASLTCQILNCQVYTHQTPSVGYSSSRHNTQCPMKKSDNCQVIVLRQIAFLAFLVAWQLHLPSFSQETPTFYYHRMV